MPPIPKKLFPSHPSRNVYLGVDPGASGGLAAIFPPFVGAEGVIQVRKMPESDTDLWKWIRQVKDEAREQGCWVFSVLEKVGGYTKRDGAQPGSAMFVFGANYGRVRMALVAAEIPLEEVIPARWQSALHVGKRGKTEDKSAFKRRLKEKAQQLFPTVSVTLANADALLIAEYCRRFREGLLK